MIMIACAITFIATLLLVGLLAKSSRLKKRTWDDYYPLLREFNWPEAKLLFDHGEEERLKDVCGELFRREQRARLDLAFELVGRACHDNRLSREWISTERYDMIEHHLEYEPAVVEAMRLALKEMEIFKWMGLWCLTRMWLLGLFWNMLPVPSISARRKIFGEDLLQSYERVRQAIANFARLAYTEDEADLILAKM